MSVRHWAEQGRVTTVRSGHQPSTHSSEVPLYTQPCHSYYYQLSDFLSSSHHHNILVITCDQTLKYLTEDLLFDHWLLMSHVVLSHQHVQRYVENKPILGWHHQNHHQCHTENHVIPSSPEKPQYTYAISGPSLGTTMLMMVANKPVLSRGQFLRCAITEYTGSDCVTDTISLALVS